MKIIHVVPGLTKGGGERVAVDLSNHAAAEGYDVTILTAFPGDPATFPAPLDPRIQLRSVSPHRPSRLGRYISLIPWVIRNRHWLASHDILHCHMTFGAAMGCAVQLVRTLFRLPGPKVIETYHAVGSSIPPLNRWIHAKLLARRDAVALMAEDPYWTRFVQRHPHLLSQVIRNGVSFRPVPGRESAEVRVYRAAIGVPEGCVVGTIGRMAPERKPHLYIPVLARITGALGGDVAFLMGGEGPELDGVKQLAAQHGLTGKVHFPGFVLDPALPLSLMDLYVALNVGPVAGVATLEAAFAGVPIVALQVLPGREAEECDWIWSSDDPDAVADRAIALLEDVGARRTLAAAQRAHVQAHHGVASMAQAYYGLYRRALEAPRRLPTG